MSVSPGASPIPCLPCTSDPVEPPWSELGTRTRIKSPAQSMHFTACMPLRLLADALDANAWMCPPGHPPYVCPGTEVRFYVDGQLAGAVPPSPDDMNLWELRLPSGLPAGDHVVTVTYVPFSPGGGTATPIAGSVPVTIHIDPAPAHGGTIVLTQNLVLSGSTPLDWTDKTVIGNGFRVTAAAGYSGSITIQNSFVSGLGSFSTSGIDVTTTGAVSVQGSIFEATGAMRVAAQCGASVTVTNNELRANNLLTYVASNPDVPVALELVGGNSGVKVLQGNRIGAGILRLQGNGWQIGGLAPGEGNVLRGPRAVLHLVSSSNDVIQGNYLRHDYNGGFSQGLNLWFEGSSDNALVEHNVIRGGSWPIQNFGGEFRYNLVIDSGHNFWRGALDNAQIHHNVFAHASGVNTGYSGAILVYGGANGLNVYNNTFDLAGATGSFDAPAFTIGSGAVLNSIRNNLFTNFDEVSSTYARAFVSSDDAVGAPRVNSADYNGFHNPLAPNTARYRTGIVAATPGQHDVQANPQLSSESELPYRISEGCVWTGACTVGQVLGHYRNVYRPTPGSPLIDAGDPADGVGTAIGAVGPDDSNPVDLFGRLVPAAPPPDTQPPTVTLTAPSNGGTVSGVTTITATAFDNIGVAGVKFLIDGTQTGSEQTGTPDAHCSSRVGTGAG